MTQKIQSKKVTGDQNASGISFAVGASVECDIHVWKEVGGEMMVDLYTISKGNVSICRALPLEMAMRCLSEYIEEMTAA